MGNLIKSGCLLKHTFSSVGDLLIEFEADMLNKVVETNMKWFDSSLFADFVVTYLPRAHGIVAYRDDNAKGNHWITPDADFKLFANFRGQRFRAQVVLLVKTGNSNCAPKAAVILDTKDCEQQRLF